MCDWELAGTGPWLDALSAVREQADKQRPTLGAEQALQMDEALKIFNELVPRHADPMGTAELTAEGTRVHNADANAFTLEGAYKLALVPAPKPKDAKKDAKKGDATDEGAWAPLSLSDLHKIAEQNGVSYKAKASREELIAALNDAGVAPWPLDEERHKGGAPISDKAAAQIVAENVPVADDDDLEDDDTDDEPGKPKTAKKRRRY